MSLPKPYYHDERAGIVIYNADCLDILPHLDSVDAVISDPPYGEEDTHAKHLGSVILKNGEPARQALGFDGISQEEAVQLAAQWCAIAKRWVVFTCEWKYQKALDDAGLLVRFGIWRKPDGAPQFTGDRPGTGWEAVAICHRPGKKRWNGGGASCFLDVPEGAEHERSSDGKTYRPFYIIHSRLYGDGRDGFGPLHGVGDHLAGREGLRPESNWNRDRGEIL